MHAVPLPCHDVQETYTLLYRLPSSGQVATVDGRAYTGPMARKRTGATRKPPAREPSRPIPVRLSPDLIRRARALADADRRPLSAYLRLLVERGVETAERGA